MKVNFKIFLLAFCGCFLVGSGLFLGWYIWGESRSLSSDVHLGSWLFADWGVYHFREDNIVELSLKDTSTERFSESPELRPYRKFGNDLIFIFGQDFGDPPDLNRVTDIFKICGRDGEDLIVGWFNIFRDNHINCFTKVTRTDGTKEWVKLKKEKDYIPLSDYREM